MSQPATPERCAAHRPVSLSLSADDTARALAILAELERPAMPTFEVHQARPRLRSAEHEVEFYAVVFVGGGVQKTGRHRSLLGCMAAIVEIVRGTR